MIKQEVIAKSLTISRIGEKHHFQMPLPRDAVRIIGVEYGTSEKYGVPVPSPYQIVESSMPVHLNKVIGRLTLKAAGCEGIFYQGDLVEDRNIEFGETVAHVIWDPLPWSHGRKRHEIEINISENRMVQGFFQDCWGADEYESLSYKMNLYLWIEKCEK